MSSRKAVSAICLAIPGQIIDVVDDQNRLAQVDEEENFQKNTYQQNMQQYYGR